MGNSEDFSWNFLVSNAEWSKGGYTAASDYTLSQNTYFLVSEAENYETVEPVNPLTSPKTLHRFQTGLQSNTCILFVWKYFQPRHPKRVTYEPTTTFSNSKIATVCEDMYMYLCVRERYCSKRVFLSSVRLVSTWLCVCKTR